MKFVKGVLVGTLACASLAIWYTDGMHMNKKKMMKKGRNLVKKIGII